jgi:hypothetical protein
MLNGIRSGAGKLTYSEDNGNIESFDGEWEYNIKKNGLLTYREYTPKYAFISVLAAHSIMGISPLETSAMVKGYCISQVVHGMRDIGRIMRCTENLESAALKMYPLLAVKPQS